MGWLVQAILTLLQGGTKKQTSKIPPGYLSQHFRAAEFTCNHCGELPRDKYPPERLLDFLEVIRTHFGNKSVNINSGYRCPTHNRNVGGAPNSYHLKGMAADFWIKGVSHSDVQDYAERLIGNSGGVGRYSTFTHIDVRGSRARWSG